MQLDPGFLTTEHTIGWLSQRISNIKGRLLLGDSYNQRVIPRQLALWRGKADHPCGNTSLSMSRNSRRKASSVCLSSSMVPKK